MVRFRRKQRVWIFGEDSKETNFFVCLQNTDFTEAFFLESF
jgi:hypothetical protein